MITHVVLFWLDKPYGQNRDQFLSGAKTLAQIPGILEFRCGKPVPNPRGVVDESFAVGISMTFENQAAYDLYQNHPIHMEFVTQFVKTMARRTLVYDWE